MESNRYRFVRLASVVVLALIGNTALTAGTIYVDLLAPGNNSGTTWEDAYICLQNALERAEAGDEIRVAQGLYQPDRSQTRAHGPSYSRDIDVSGDRTDSFILPDGVTMRGGYAGFGTPDPDARDPETHPSILSGDLEGNDPNLTGFDEHSLGEFIRDPNLSDNSYTVVLLDGASAETVLDGFVITAGRSEGTQFYRDSQGFIKPYPSPYSHGAGAWISQGQPMFVRCTFLRNVIHAEEPGHSGGAAVLIEDSAPAFIDCAFDENIVAAWNMRHSPQDIVATGGAILNLRSDPNFVGCTFTRNAVSVPEDTAVGGAMANLDSRPSLTSCSFTANQCFDGDGGAIFNDTVSYPQVTACIFERNSASFGGAMYTLTGGKASLTGCTFLRNETIPGRGGALYNSDRSAITALNCRFIGNAADSLGGAVYDSGEPVYANCVFNGNVAERGGAIAGAGGEVSVINSTFTANIASETGGAYDGLISAAVFTNCILWDNGPEALSTFVPRHPPEVTYCDIQGGWDGEGNIDADPAFRDPLGPDGVAGTIDDDLRLSPGSACINAGDNSVLPELPPTDANGLPRLNGNRIDIGAYEFQGALSFYVDAATGSDTNSGLSWAEPFATIQKGIDAAPDSYSVEVAPGLYTEGLAFGGKAIVVTGSGGAAVLEAPGDYAVSFYAAEGPDSVLKNFVIRNSAMGIFISGGAPTLRNLTVVNNEFGIAAYSGANPDISNCILWSNAAGDLFDCTARYSCIERAEQATGEGNISEDPLFADAAGGDYHLRSEGGRCVPAYGLWSFDMVTSPCVDAGDPAVGSENERVPNGERINIGAYGGTAQASLSLCLPCFGP